MFPAQSLISYEFTPLSDFLRELNVIIDFCFQTVNALLDTVRRPDAQFFTCLSYIRHFVGARVDPASGDVSTGPLGES